MNTRRAFPFFFYLTGIIIVDILQDVKASNNSKLSLQAPFIAWSCHKCVGDDSSNSWKQIILQTSTLVITGEPHRPYPDNHLHFFFRLLLYSFPGGEIFGAWFARVTCQKAIVIIPILNFPNGWIRFGTLDQLFRVSGISYPCHFYGSRLCVVREVRRLQCMKWSHMWACLCPCCVCWILA